MRFHKSNLKKISTKNMPLKAVSFTCISAAIFLAACGKDSSTSSATDPADTPQVSQYPCHEALEGVVAYLKLEKTGYICQSGRWVSYEDPELFSRIEEMPACSGTDKVVAALERTQRTTLVCHDRDWFFKEE